MNKYLPIVLTAVIVGAVAFFGGMQFSKSQNPGAGGGNGQRGQFQRNGAAGANGAGIPGGFAGGAGRMGNMTTGEIINSDDKSITLKLRDGGSKIIFFSGSTQLSKQAEATATDLEKGKTVMVGGTTNSDGSITAQTIQVRPALPAPTTPATTSTTPVTSTTTTSTAPTATRAQ